jgi:soluble lytic murein transglycosylase-like protein
MEGSTAPGKGEMDTQAQLGFDPSGKHLKMNLGITHPIPTVLPGLVTREIYLPPKVIAPPLVMAGRVEKPSKALLARIRLSKRAKIKPVNRHFRKLIHQAADRHGIEPAMIKAIIMAESSFDPKAVSNRGALGLMQLMPQTAESLGVADAFDPGNNIDAGARYLRQLLNHFRGDIELALAAYNAGIQNVLNHRGIPPYKATQSYVEKVLTYYEHYKRMVTS